MNRIRTGIDGVDRMTEGGFPEGHLIALVGPFGAGKTTFALQYIREGLANGETCMYLSLEEGEDRLIKTALNYGWDLKEHIESEELTILKVEASDITNSLSHLESSFPATIRSIGASRVVIDPFTLFEMLFEDEAKRRKNVFDLCDVISNTGATVLITSEVNEERKGSRYGLVEYIVDGVILLRRTSDDYGRVRHSIQVEKMRWSNHSNEIKPYEVTKDGFKVYIKSKVY